jgi:homogentisate 1,2-dioxygenase
MTPSESSPLAYLSGFGNEFESESLPGALPVGRNSPQRTPYGLYAEQLSGSPFIATRAATRRSWLYRRLPSAMHGEFAPLDQPRWLGEPVGRAPGNRIRLAGPPPELQAAPFPQGLATVVTTGSCAGGHGGALHLWSLPAGPASDCFSNADAEMLWLPTGGQLLLATEFGRLAVAPGEIALIPRGVRFSVQGTGGPASGYLLENFGAPFQLPDLGPIGANGLAAARDFLHPVAHCEEDRGPVRWINKFDGGFWATTLPSTPLNVVAWRGNYAPWKYDLARFMVINTVSFDHADPSIFTVLTSPGAGTTPNLELAIFPPRWIVANDTFRPPWFHRNVMSEAMGLIHGQYEVRGNGFTPGGVGIHNCMMAHGPDARSWEQATSRELAPEYLKGTLAFVLESPRPFVPTPLALTSAAREQNYDAVWNGFRSANDRNA